MIVWLHVGDFGCGKGIDDITEFFNLSSKDILFDVGECLGESIWELYDYYYELADEAAEKCKEIIKEAKLYDIDLRELVEANIRRIIMDKIEVSLDDVPDGMPSNMVQQMEQEFNSRLVEEDKLQLANGVIESGDGTDFESKAAEVLQNLYTLVINGNECEYAIDEETVSEVIERYFSDEDILDNYSVVYEKIVDSLAELGTEELREDSTEIKGVIDRIIAPETSNAIILFDNTVIAEIDTHEWLRKAIYDAFLKSSLDADEEADDEEETVDIDVRCVSEKTSDFVGCGICLRHDLKFDALDIENMRMSMEECFWELIGEFEWSLQQAIDDGRVNDNSQESLYSVFGDFKLLFTKDGEEIPLKIDFNPNEFMYDLFSYLEVDFG